MTYTFTDTPEPPPEPPPEAWDEVAPQDSEEKYVPSDTPVPDLPVEENPGEQLEQDYFSFDTPVPSPQPDTTDEETRP